MSSSLGELTRGFGRADARVLAQLLGDVVDEVLVVRELTVGSDSHDPLVHTTLSKPFCSSS